MKMHQGIKDARRARAKELENLSQEKRVYKIEDSGELELKRSLLSSDPELRERIKALREVVEGLRTKYPEIIGITLFGSHTKGYANEKSDIDACIYLDEEKVRIASHTMNHEEKVFDSPHFLQIQEEISSGISHAGLKQQSGGIIIYLISKDKLVERCHKGSFSINTIRLFHLAAGKGIYEYREIVISTLENMVEDGERMWKNLMHELSVFENLNLDTVLREKRKDLYPKTLVEGRSYFLRNIPKG